MRTRILRSSSIVAKLMLATGLVALLVVVATVAVSFRQQKRAAEMSVAETLDRVSRARASSIGLWFDAHRLLVEMANDEIALRGTSGDMAPIFRHAALSKNFGETYFGGADGSFRESAGAEPPPPGYDPRSRPWYRAAVARRATVLTEPYLDASTGEPVVTVTTPLFVGGRLLGVTGADFSMRDVLAMLRNVRLRDSDMFIIDERGTILVHPDARLVGKTIGQAFAGYRLSPAAAFVEVTQFGRPRLLATAPIPDLPGVHWRVGVALDRASAYADVQAARRQALLLTALAVVASMLMMWLALARVVLSPLRTIAASMRDISAGRFDERIDHAERTDEIGDMARAVEVFRDNGLRIAELTEAETRRLEREAETRRRMVADLRGAFGEVVDAAIEGDFSRRVGRRFDDDEFNALAHSIDRLVETTDRGLAETGRVLGALAASDLTMRVTGQYDGAFAKLKDDTNAVADALHSIMGQLRETSRHAKASTTDLVDEIRRLSDRTQHQTRAVEDTAAAVHRLNETVGENAESAEVASRQAREIGASAETGGDLLARTIEAMRRLDVSSTRISRIITMMDTIASQTSLLALNATIEAARVGVAGRGFAVVAAEIRTLASNAAEASSEASRLVGETLHELGTGSRMIEEVGGNLTTVLAAVRENRHQLDAIATTSREQANSIGSIGEAVDQLGRIARDNNALADQLSGTTGDMETRAREIDGLIEGFTVDRSGPRSAAA